MTSVVVVTIDLDLVTWSLGMTELTILRPVIGQLAEEMQVTRNCVNPLSEAFMN